MTSEPRPYDDLDFDLETVVVEEDPWVAVKIFALILLFLAAAALIFVVYLVARELAEPLPYRDPRG